MCCRGKHNKFLERKFINQFKTKNDGYYCVIQKIDKQYFQRVHRSLALHYIPNPHLAKCVDQIDNNKKNNCLSNLHWASNQKNSMNMKKHKNSSSNFKGVTFHQKAGKWQAQIQNNGEKFNLGLFISEEEAGRVYDRKGIELFAEFAKTNFPLEDYQQEE